MNSYKKTDSGIIIPKNLISNKKSVSQDPLRLAYEAHETFKDSEIVLRSLIKEYNKSLDLNKRNIARNINDKMKTNEAPTLTNVLTQTSVGYGYKEPVYAYPSEYRERLAADPYIEVIIGYLISRLSDFFTAKVFEDSAGFVIRPKKHLFKKTGKLTDSQKTEIEYITNIITNCGDKKNKYYHELPKNESEGYTNWKDTFVAFMKHLIRDSAVHDTATAQIRRDRLGRIIDFMPLYGGSMRYANGYGTQKEDWYTLLSRESKEPQRYYKREQVMWGARRPSTDPFHANYGIPEIDAAHPYIQMLKAADESNAKIFTQGSMAKGMLIAKDLMNSNVVNALKRSLANIQGVEGSHQILNVPLDPSEFKFENMVPSNRDMEFSELKATILQTLFALYQMSPVEVDIALKIGGAPLINNDNTNTKLKYANSRWLKPWLSFFSDLITRNLIDPFFEGYELVFVGIEPEDRERDLANMEKEVEIQKKLAEVNKIRMELGQGVLGIKKDNESILTLEETSGKLEPKQPNQNQDESIQKAYYYEGSTDYFNREEEDEINRQVVREIYNNMN